MVEGLLSMSWDLTINRSFSPRENWPYFISYHRRDTWKSIHKNISYILSTHFIYRGHIIFYTWRSILAIGRIYHKSRAARFKRSNLGVGTCHGMGLSALAVKTLAHNWPRTVCGGARRRDIQYPMRTAALINSPYNAFRWSTFNELSSTLSTLDDFHFRSA